MKSAEQFQKEYPLIRQQQWVERKKRLDAILDAAIERALLRGYSTFTVDERDNDRFITPSIPAGFTIEELDYMTTVLGAAGYFWSLNNGDIRIQVPDMEERS